MELESILAFSYSFDVINDQYSMYCSVCCARKWFWLGFHWQVRSFPSVVVLHMVKFCPGPKPILNARQILRKPSLHFYQIAQIIPALSAYCAHYSCTIIKLRKLFLHYQQIVQTIPARQISQLHKRLQHLDKNRVWRTPNCVCHGCEVLWQSDVHWTQVLMAVLYISKCGLNFWS